MKIPNATEILLRRYYLYIVNLARRYMIYGSNKGTISEKRQ